MTHANSFPRAAAPRTPTQTQRRHQHPQAKNAWRGPCGHPLPYKRGDRHDRHDHHDRYDRSELRALLARLGLIDALDSDEPRAPKAPKVPKTPRAPETMKAPAPQGRPALRAPEPLTAAKTAMPATGAKGTKASPAMPETAPASITALCLVLILFAAPAEASASLPDASSSGLSPEDEWGCKVLLCLADPRGPRTESECRPPIDRLYAELRSRHPHFPKCPMAGDGNYAEALLDPFDPCSLAGDGLEDAPEGYVAEGRRIETRPGRYRTEITKAPRLNTAGRERGEDSATRATKACVKDPQGTYRWSEGWGDSVEHKSARLYGTVLWLEPKSARAIDVYIDGTLWQRVRY